MNILLLGSGGRECTFAWKISQSNHCDQLYIAPGNAGTSAYGKNLSLQPTDFNTIKKAVLEHQIEMVVVGPEAPLVMGIVDFFTADESLNHIMIIGPNKEAAQLEGSKSYAKRFMADFNIPTAAYRSFTKDTLDEGLDFIQSQSTPIVLKADGLAAGKGVLICNTKSEAKQEFKAMLSGKFGGASETVVVEAFLDGIEFSVFALTDGNNYILLPAAKDYKRIGEGDSGLNTGGMGSLSPVPFLDEALAKKVEERIVKPTIDGIRSRQLGYQGFVFFGLISVNGDPYVIEYNCRMGDPETQSVLTRLDHDLVQLLIDTAKGKLGNHPVNHHPFHTATIVLVSGGYPEAYEKDKPISGLDRVKDAWLFHAGTKGTNPVLTNGGRVLGITAKGNTLSDALASAKEEAVKINYDGKYFRTDIGFEFE